MCLDPVTAAALAGGAGILQAVATDEAESRNIDAAIEDEMFNREQAAREFRVEADASNREAFDAAMTRDREVAAAKAGAGFAGSTAQARVAEQKQQGSLAISRAGDRKEAAQANFTAENKGKAMETANFIETSRTSPLAHVVNIGSSAAQSYAAFA